MISKNTTERAGVWIRVSTGGQDEAQQVPAVEGHCASRNYTITRRYELNDKSASKGEQQKKLGEMLADMRNGVLTVLVCWRSNRLERRGPESVFRLKRQVTDAGGRIEVTTEPSFSSLDLSGEAITALNAVIDSQFSVKLSEDVLRSITQIKANGYVWNGNIGWGYVIEGPKYAHTIAPTEECRIYAPQIFARCIKGDSLRKMAAWLDSEGIATRNGGKWNEGSVRWIIRNRMYAGRLLDSEGNTIVRCEAVVNPDIWERANESLKNRPKRGPIAVDKRPLLAGLKCARCADSPMYRINAIRGSRKRYFYRCTGRGPQRKGCGNMIELGALEARIITRFETSTKPHQTRRWIEGKNWDAEIADVNQDIRELTANPLAEGFIARMTECTAKLAELTAMNKNRERGHNELADVLNPDGSVMTQGQHFASLDNEGQREYLKSCDIRAKRVGNGFMVTIDAQGIYTDSTAILFDSEETMLASVAQ